uniref:Uncharacterized protein n=1 Tax=Nicotiana tabacum TaxID=4097 RepID=A0A1S4A6I4_TOBAC|nr:PREDICTED: uncharacterized protein LOC107794214 [Nicotiana tabacum]
METVSRIGSAMGNPLYADDCTTKVDRISYARLLIEMDVTKELPQKLAVKDPQGKLFTQEVHYDWVPDFCGSCLQLNPVILRYIRPCLQVGHDCAKNKAQVRKEVKEKTQNIRGRNHNKQWIWQTKQPQEQVVVQKQGTGKDSGSSQQNDTKEDEGWQEARRKSASKGTKNASIEPNQVPTNNGFGPLSECNILADKGRVIIEGQSSKGRGEGRVQSSQYYK